MKKSPLIAFAWHTVIASTPAMLFTSTPAAMAQAADTLTEVVVTARKREENLQDIPLTINVVGTEELLRANVFTMDELSQMTPGLAFNDVNGAYQAPAIRGVAQIDGGGFDGNVGVFIDGVYLDNRSSLEFGMLELDRVEILKGPQSALYGRNTFAGAINYVTTPPKLGEWSGLAEAGFGSDDFWSARASVNIPLGSKFAARVFAGDSAFGGNVDNQRDGKHVGGYRQRRSMGAQLLFAPTDAVSLKVVGIRNERDDEQPAYRIYPSANNNCGATFNLAPQGQPVRPVPSLFCGEAPETENTDLDARGAGLVGKVDLLYATLRAEFANATATLQVSSSESTYGTFVDAAGNPTAFQRPLFGNFSLQFFTNAASDKGEATSYEFRVESKAGEGFQWMAGAAYFDITGNLLLSSSATPIGQLAPLTALSRVVRSQETEEFAIFGSVGFERGPFGASLELRYNEVDQDFSGSTTLLFVTVPPTIVPANAQSFQSWTPRVSVDYDLTDQVMLYATAARGWKAGGFNVAAQPNAQFGPEVNDSYEAGVKSTLLDGRLVLNGAVYFIDWKDLQIPSPIDAFGNTAILNLAGATSKGVEIEASALLTENLSVRVGASVLDPKFDAGTLDGSLIGACGLLPNAGRIGAPCSTDVGGNQIPRVPKQQLAVGATQTWRSLVGDFDAYARIDYSYASRRYNDSFGAAHTGDARLMDLRLGATNGRTEVALWATNLLDEPWVRGIQAIPDTGANAACGTRGQNCSANLLRVYRGDGRRFGLTATWRF